MKVKKIWDNKDFEVMGWHDSRLYSVSFPDENFELKFSLDYIFKTEKINDSAYNFWVSRCSLVFKNVSDVQINLYFENSIGIDVQELKRTNNRKSPNGKSTIWDYILETDKGNIQFSATGFVQKMLFDPRKTESMDLGINYQG